MGMADDLPKGKLLGKLRQIWSKLSDGENYLIPESIEEIKVLGPFPFFQIKQTPIYAKDVDSTQRAFYDFAGELRSFMGENRYSSATLIEATRNQIRENFSCEEQKPFEWHLCQVISLAQAQNKLRLFVMALDGLDLIDFHEIQAGSWRLVDFTKDEAKMHLDKISGDHQWKEHISQLFANEFIGRKCILVAAQGDREQARLNADRTARFVINTLRYAICIHLAHVSRAHECGIDSPSGTDSWSFKYFQYELDSGEAWLGRGARQRQNYKLNAANRRKLKAEWDFDAVWS